MLALHRFPKRARVIVRRLRLALPAVFVAILVGCATPVGVKRMSARAVHHTLTANALSSDEPSTFSAQLLQRVGLRERFQQEPEEVLAELHAALSPSRAPNLLFALSELSFLHAEKRGERPYFLASAVYAYAFLFSKGSSLHPFDP
ncbi:MAG: hypothetical protein V3T33_01990, partial [Myxococcota bacterium]